MIQEDPRWVRPSWSPVRRILERGAETTAGEFLLRALQALLALLRR